MVEHKSEQFVQRLEQLIGKGRRVLSTHRENAPGVIGFPTLDAGKFIEWRTQSLSCLVSLLGESHIYVDNFKKNIKEGYQKTVESGIGIISAVKEDLEAGFLDREPELGTFTIIERLCKRFHIMARQLRSRHNARVTLDVQDEYDVQDLLHALLVLHFDDVRPEEHTPSYAGNSSRMDFLLKKESLVIEVKKTRGGLGVKELSKQLIEDIERYKSHQGCGMLVCFVYDPEGLIPNPRGIEADLNRDDSPFPVRVLIRPE